MAGDFIHPISAYGGLFVGGMITLETMGIPVPGETALITAAVLAGTRQDLNIWSVVIVGVLGAICGNLVAFSIGRYFGHHFLRRHGSWIRLTPSRLKIGQYLFLRHGGKFVFFARFVPLLRSIAGILAGANDMRFDRFLIATVAGAVIWIGVDCTAAYFLGHELKRVAAWAGIVIGALVVLVALALVLITSRYENELALRAERALPGDAR